MISDPNDVEETRELACTLRKIMEDPRFAGARLGVGAHDLERGSPAFEYNAQEIFVGASTTKIPTVAYALSLLGCDHQFRTRMFRTGAIADSGILQGDLIFVASGDPNLSNRVTPEGTLDYESLDHASAGAKARLFQRNPLQVIDAFTRAVRDAGIRRVAGTVLIDIELFEEGYREPGTYTTISPVAINDNLIDVEATGGARSGDPITYSFSPRTGYVRFVDQATTGTSDSEPKLRFSRERRGPDGTWTVVISGSVPPGSTSMAAFPVESPSRFARTLLVESLASAGIVVEGGLSGENTIAAMHAAELVLIYEHVSPPMSEAAKVVLKVSQNLHAEMMLPLIGAIVCGAQGERASAAGYARSAELLERWGVDTIGMFQGDACGARGHFSPDFMCRLLRRVACSDIADALLYGLPVLGKDGTLWDIQPNSPAAGHVYAKTGTYSFVDPINDSRLYVCKGLAGYVDAKSGRRFAFAIYLNNLHLRSSSSIDPGQVLGEIANLLYEHL